MEKRLAASILASGMDGEPSSLEDFREQWRREVIARSQQRPVQQLSTGRTTSSGESPERSRQPRVRPPTNHPAADIKDDDQEHDDGSAAKRLAAQFDQLEIGNVDEDNFTPKDTSEPVSALEHYERAVEKEIEGKLGDSVSHYRRAYRLDARVDQTYKNKHFPAASKPAKATQSNSQSTSGAIPHAPAEKPGVNRSTPELIGSFAGLPIAPAEPIIKGDHPPSCPIASIPSEILHEIYLQTAISDPAAFVRLALVCRKLAYDVFTDQRVWKRVALGAEFGLASQKYDFSCDLKGREIIHQSLDFREERPVVDEKSIKEPQHKNWREVFHSHPRIRFNGVYISTVNYTRAGYASATSATWNTPIHIVTYYRYLRFFRDGTVISLLTVHEPVDVVHHLTKSNVDLVRQGGKEGHHSSTSTSASSVLAGNVLPPQMPPTPGLIKHALRGRWRLCHPSVDRDDTDVARNTVAEEGDVHIETEGVGPRYMYTMHLSLKSSSRLKTAVKNNKLQWKGFWSFNHLTSDWAEFQLKNDRAYIFSRVRSYGMGS